ESAIPRSGRSGAELSIRGWLFGRAPATSCGTAYHRGVRAPGWRRDNMGWGWMMAHMRFCYYCGEEVRTIEERLEIPGSHKTKLQLSCPNCKRILASLYDDERELRPVPNVRSV